MLEIDLKFKLNGREVSFDGFVDAVSVRLIEAVKSAAKQQWPQAQPPQVKPHNAKPEPLAFSVAETASLLSVSKATISRRIREGRRVFESERP
jgi:hypothetical protein